MCVGGYSPKCALNIQIPKKRMKIFLACCVRTLVNKGATGYLGFTWKVAIKIAYMNDTQYSCLQGAAKKVTPVVFCKL